MVETSPLANIGVHPPISSSHSHTQNKTQSTNYPPVSTPRTTKKRGNNATDPSTPSTLLKPLRLNNTLPPTPSTQSNHLRLNNTSKSLTNMKRTSTNKNPPDFNVNPSTKLRRTNQHIRHSIMPDPSDPSGQAIEGECSTDIEMPEYANHVPVPRELVPATRESAVISPKDPQGFKKGKKQPFKPKPQVNHLHGNLSLPVHTGEKVSSAQGNEHVHRLPGPNARIGNPYLMVPL